MRHSKMLQLKHALKESLLRRRRHKQQPRPKKLLLFYLSRLTTLQFRLLMMQRNLFLVLPKRLDTSSRQSSSRPIQ